MRRWPPILPPAAKGGAFLLASPSAASRSRSRRSSSALAALAPLATRCRAPGEDDDASARSLAAFCSSSSAVFLAASRARESPPGRMSAPSQHASASGSPAHLPLSQHTPASLTRTHPRQSGSARHARQQSSRDAGAGTGGPRRRSPPRISTPSQILTGPLSGAAPSPHTSPVSPGGRTPVLLSRRAKPGDGFFFDDSCDDERDDEDERPSPAVPRSRFRRSSAPLSRPSAPSCALASSRPSRCASFLCRSVHPSAGSRWNSATKPVAWRRSCRVSLELGSLPTPPSSGTHATMHISASTSSSRPNPMNPPAPSCPRR
mmetsp:Transcript_13454/g.56919  ORF Transcript_13454/g.56919 Transcript_13454/m.56919 type:complete len:318 (-) Transcript_13454:218-1171(-)